MGEPDFNSGYADGVEDAKNFVSDYLGSLLDSGNLEGGEYRLVENILGYFENTLDPATL
jgi:hypothetical protein